MAPASPSAMAGMLLAFGLYSLLVLVPARDIVQGWLGMVAGRRPTSYSERGENLGRVLGDLVLVVAFLWIMVATFGVLSEREDASSNAFGFAYMMFALLAFGLGSAVPRLWFALSSRDLYSSDAMPELLVQAGKRASIFCYAAFMSAGLALTGARVTALARGMAPAARHRGMAVPPPPAPPLVKAFSGALCLDGPGCYANQTISVTATRTGLLSIQVLGEKDLLLCPIGPVGRWTSDGALAQMDQQFNTAWREGEVAVAGRPPVVVEVQAGVRVSLAMYLQEGMERCGYHLIIRQPPTGAAPGKGAP